MLIALTTAALTALTLGGLDRAIAYWIDGEGV